MPPHPVDLERHFSAYGDGEASCDRTLSAFETAAAHSLGRRSNDAVADRVRRFNQEGVPAIEPRHGGGASVQYGADERERVLREFRRTPDREPDGTATWSLTTLQRALREADDGLPTISSTL